jgi:hypothetical protein
VLKANGEDVKVVQELLRHGSSRMTLDVYTQAKMPQKRAAQQKVVNMVRSEASPFTAEQELNCSPNSYPTKVGGLPLNH